MSNDTVTEPYPYLSATRAEVVEKENTEDYFQHHFTFQKVVKIPIDCLIDIGINQEGRR